MNINDVKEEDIIVPEDIWGAIWQHQKELHDKYGPIEAKTGIGFGLVQDRPFNLDNQRWQYYLKDMSYRVIEELAEADEADRECNTEHYEEELIDALHFIVELNVILKQPVCTDIICPDSPIEYWDITYELGMAGNCLKMKPWKQDPMLTDKKKYRKHVKYATMNMIGMLRRKFTDEEIYLLYFKKNQVNQFRQRSNY